MKLAELHEDGHAVRRHHGRAPRAPAPRRHHRVAAQQGLTLVHYSAQRKHILWDTLGA